MTDEHDGAKSSPKLFVLIVSIIIIFLFVSLVFAVSALFSSSLLERVVFLGGIGLLGVMTFVLFFGYTKRELSGTSFGPLCKALLQEFSLCARCKGFYAGFAIFGIMLAINSRVYVDVLNRIMLIPYLFVLTVATMSVPIHGGLRRLNIIQSSNLLHVIGFFFSVSPYLVASLVLYLANAV